MTIVAGAFALNSAAIADDLKASLRLHLRSVHDKSGQLFETETADFFLTKWDSLAYKEEAWSEHHAGCTSTLVGDSLLTKAGVRVDRSEQLNRLTDSSGKLVDSVLASTRGAFSVVAFSSEARRLELATDMVGLRPLYFTVQKGIFIFASTLRTLESTNWIVKTRSAAGSLETCVFGFPLAQRTQYEGISVLRECQRLTVYKGGAPEFSNYFDWTETHPTECDQSAIAKNLMQEFQQSIQLRLGVDHSSYAFLSGGMDSRAIVSSLAKVGCNVEALNFSPDSSQDQVYARLYAETLKKQCKLHFLPRDENPNFSMLAFAAKSKLESSQGICVDRPAFLWSGDGGSVGLGHVYMDEEAVRLAEKGEFEEALTHFLKFNGLGLPVNAMTKRGGAATSNLIQSNALAEINRYPVADGGRRIYLFLLFNDQRRHLFKHFETIDRHGLEFLLPFYDVAFLKKVVESPAKWGILHRLYSTWFDELAPTARATPWQTYPGHVPCPIHGDATLSYQWAGRTSRERQGFGERLTCARQLIAESVSASLPPMFSRARVFLAASLHAAGLRDCRHILTMLTTYRQLGKHAST